MPKSLTPKKTTDLQPAGDRAAHYARSATADNTRRAYAGAWAEFAAWCADRGVPSLPAAPVTVADYLAERAARDRVSTIGVKMAAIRKAHDVAGHVDPTKDERVRLVYKGIRRQHGKPPTKKAAVSNLELRAIVAAQPDTLIGQRNRALILTGFTGAFRRSELVGIDVEDLRFVGEVMKITVKRSKTDPEGRGMIKSIPRMETAELDAVAAMRAWLKAAGIKSGPVFRRVDRWGHLRAERLAPQAVALILKDAATAAGLDPRQFAGHSLRSGFITAAASAGAQEWKIQQQTGHKSERVLRGYIQDDGRGAQEAARAAINGHAEKDEGER